MKNPLQSIHLYVKDLERSAAFYRDLLGFSQYEQESKTIWLGAPGKLFLELREHSGGKNIPGTTGLYHFAVLLPDRLSLALQLKQLFRREIPLQGFADHGVSEAIYLQDPDRNGIELYRDRPREEWPKKNGQLRMTTDPLDTRDLLELVRDRDPAGHHLPPQTRLGHVHLQVDAIRTAEDFYQRILGMDLMQRYGSGASFFSYHGYHHHIGANTWHSTGAPPPPPDAPGLGWVTLEHHPDMDLDKNGDTPPPHGVDQPGRWVMDPAGNRFLIQENPA